MAKPARMVIFPLATEDSQHHHRREHQHQRAARRLRDRHQFRCLVRDLDHVLQLGQQADVVRRQIGKPRTHRTQYHEEPTQQRENQPKHRQDFRHRLGVMSIRLNCTHAVAGADLDLAVYFLSTAGQARLDTQAPSARCVPGGTSRWAGVKVNRTAPSGSLPDNQTANGSEPRTLSTAMRKLPRRLLRTTTRSGSRRRRAVVIGEALAAWTNDPVASLSSVPSLQTTLNARSTSSPGRGSGASMRAFNRACSPARRYNCGRGRTRTAAVPRGRGQRRTAVGPCCRAGYRRGPKLLRPSDP